MTTLLFANNEGSTLAGAITSTAVTLNLQSGGGAGMPNPTAGQYFVLTLTDAATGLLNEIVWVTARSGDTLTIARAQEGTTALAWNAGDLANMYITAGMLAQFSQQGTIGPTSLVHYGVTVGTNALTTTLNPPIAALADGILVELTPVANNTGPVTLNPNGVGAAPVVTLTGAALPANTLVPGQPVLAMCLGGSFVVLTYNNFQPVLSAPTTYYVNASTGNDANNGLTSGTAFATLQHAANVAATFNLNGYAVTVNVANGSYAPVVLPPINGSGTVAFVGNSGSPSSVVIAASTGSAVTASGCGTGYSFNGFTVSSAAPNYTANDGGAGFFLGGNTAMNVLNINCGVCQVAHFAVFGGANLTLGGAIRIAGGLTANTIGPGVHMWSIGGQISSSGGAGNPGLNPALTVTTLVTMTAFIAVSSAFCFVVYSSITGASNVTGSKYAASLNGVIYTGGQPTSYYPGSTSGTTSTGGQYA